LAAPADNTIEENNEDVPEAMGMQGLNRLKFMNQILRTMS